MDSLKLKSVVRKLYDGVCPICLNKLSYISKEFYFGTLENNGMVAKTDIDTEKHVVYCNKCGYHSEAIRIGLKLIPIDRIDKSNINWDKKYLEENTIVWGKEGENPFIKKDKG